MAGSAGDYGKTPCLLYTAVPSEDGVTSEPSVITKPPPGESPQSKLAHRLDRIASPAYLPGARTVRIAHSADAAAQRYEGLREYGSGGWVGASR
jgi:hypothetical protein